VLFGGGAFLLYVVGHPRHGVTTGCICTSMFQQRVASMQVSFVNSICTLKGGTHVKVVLDQVCKYAPQNCGLLIAPACLHTTCLSTVYAVLNAVAEKCMRE
jgi:hypothetical protein